MAATPRRPRLLLPFLAPLGASARLGAGTGEAAAWASNDTARPGWPPHNYCAEYTTEATCMAALGGGGGEACKWACSSRGGDRCWPTAPGWGCAYNGGGRYCRTHHEWECPPRFGQGEANGCYCWFSYRGGRDCCACPPVPRCAGREHVSCGRDAHGGSLDHLHASTCDLCEPGYTPSADRTACIASSTLTTTTPVPFAGACRIGAQRRSDCGYYGINSTECASKGCCWQADPTGGADATVPWCYHPKVDVCKIGVRTRSDCGYYGINDTECADRGCCWQADPAGGADTTVPWCYHPLVEACMIRVKNRTDCGYYGIDSTECASRGCCWQANPTSTANSTVPWCYHPAEGR